MSSSQYRLTVGRQVDKVTPNFATHRIVRRAGGGQSDTSTYEKDGEVRADLKVASVTATNREAGMTIEQKWSHGEYHERVEEQFGALVVPSVTIQAAAGDLSLVSIATAGGTRPQVTSTTAGKFAGLTPGLHVRLTGAAQFGGDPRYAVIYDVPDDETLLLAANWGDFADETPPDTDLVLTTANQYIEGVDALPVTFEERFSATDFQVWETCFAMRWNWQAQLNSQITSTMEYRMPPVVPRDRDLTNGYTDTVTQLTAAPTPQGDTDIMSHAMLVAMHDEAGAVAMRKENLSFTAQRPLQDVGDFGQVGADDFDLGTWDIQGSFEVKNGRTAAEIAAIQAAINRHHARLPGELWWNTFDPAGNVGWFGLPRIFYTGSTRQAGGPDAQVNMPQPFMCVRHPVYGYQITYCDYPAA